jgi:DNA polymerase IIIc chi subunit
MCYDVKEDKKPKALCKLIETIVNRGIKVFFLLPDTDAVGYWDALLWTYEQLSFLPHVGPEDALATVTPVLMSEKEVEPLNNATVLVCAEPILPTHDFLKKFEKLVYMSSDAVRMENILKDSILCDYEVVRYQLSDAGQWQKI